jgi:hypothetical protein
MNANKERTGGDMTTKHTPGPWHTRLDRYGDGVISTCTEDAEHRQIKTSWTTKNGTEGERDEARANAALIAAAPEMAEALRELIRVTEDRTEPQIENLRTSYRQAFYDARAALRKAVGE